MRNPVITKITADFVAMCECHNIEKLSKKITSNQYSARERALCQLCVLSFRVEVTEGKVTKVVDKKTMRDKEGSSVG